MSELIGGSREEGPRRPEGEVVGGEVVVMSDDIARFMSEPGAAGEPGVNGEPGGGDEGDEDESVPLEVDENGVPLVEDVVYELAVAAASNGREFDGRVLAELFEQAGPVGDVRLTIAIEVLRLGQKLTGDRMLRVLESCGFEGEALAGRLARDELAKTGGVVVESTTAVPVGVES